MSDDKIFLDNILRTIQALPSGNEHVVRIVKLPKSKRSKEVVLDTDYLLKKVDYLRKMADLCVKEREGKDLELSSKQSEIWDEKRGREEAIRRSNYYAQKADMLLKAVEVVRGVNDLDQTAAAYIDLLLENLPTPPWE